MKRLRNGNNVSVRNLPLRLKFYSDRAFSGQRARHGRKYNRTQFRSDFSAEKASVLSGAEKKAFYGRRSEPYGRKQVEKRNTM